MSHPRGTPPLYLNKDCLHFVTWSEMNWRQKLYYIVTRKRLYMRFRHSETAGMKVDKIWI